MLGAKTEVGQKHTGQETTIDINTQYTARSFTQYLRDPSP